MRTKNRWSTLGNGTRKGNKMYIVIDIIGIICIGLVTLAIVIHDRKENKSGDYDAYNE